MPSCSICVEDLHKPSCCIPCGHVFCIDCIHDWKQRKEAHKDWNCPQCRKHIIDTQALYIDQEDDIDKCRPLQEKLDNLEDQLRVLQSTNEQLNDENNMYKRYKAEHDQLEDKVKDITKLLSSLQKTNNSLKKDTEKLQREKKSRKYHIANLQKTINSLEISLKCEKDSNWILSKEVSNVKQQLITVEMERKEAGDALNTLKQKTDSKTANSYCERFVKVFKVHEDGAGGCVVKGRCYKSMKKNDMPHEMQINLVDGPILQSGTCSCPIGNLGTCGHVTGLLYTLAHMQSLKMKSIPSDVLKTSLPQTWHIPRGEKLSGSVSDDVVLCGYDPQSPYRQPRGLRSTIYNPIRSDLPPTSELLDAVREIESNCLLLTVVSDGDPNMTETKFGKYPKGSPLSYQQKLSSHYLMNIMDGEFPSLPVENVMENTLNVVLDQRKTTQLNSLNISPQECVQIEEMTRLQSTDPRWHAVRRDRLTASVAGEIVKRRADNDPLVARLKSTRRVVTESMRHGLLFEAIAANSYAMLNEQNVNIYPCGIIVSPHSPWLAASPDRKVYHSQMVPSYGLLEIKCPVKPLAECQYLVKDGDANWVLKKNHNYYYQIMMQLAVSGLKWCHFYVWREDEHHLECVTYNEEFWKEMKLKLDLFYFYHYLD